MKLTKSFKKYAKAFIDAFTLPDEYSFTDDEKAMLENKGYSVHKISPPIVYSPYGGAYGSYTCQIVKNADGSRLNAEESKKVADIISTYREQQNSTQPPSQKPE